MLSPFCSMRAICCARLTCKCATVVTLLYYTRISNPSILFCPGFNNVSLPGCSVGTPTTSTGEKYRLSLSLSLWRLIAVAFRITFNHFFNFLIKIGFNFLCFVERVIFHSSSNHVSDYIPLNEKIKQTASCPCPKSIHMGISVSFSDKMGCLHKKYRPVILI